MKDLRQLPDPRPELPIFARIDHQRGSLIAYQLEQDSFLVVTGDGIVCLDPESNEDDVLMLLVEEAGSIS